MAKKLIKKDGVRDAIICVLDIRGFSLAAKNSSHEKVRAFLKKFSTRVNELFASCLEQNNLKIKSDAEINQFTGDGFLVFFHNYKDASMIFRFLLQLNNEYNLLKETPVGEGFQTTVLGASVIKGQMHYSNFLPMAFQSNIRTGVGYDVNKAFRLCPIAQGQILTDQNTYREIHSNPGFVFARMNEYKFKGLEKFRPIWIIRERDKNDNGLVCCNKCHRYQKCTDMYTAGRTQRANENSVPTCNTCKEEDSSLPYACNECTYQDKNCLDRYDYYKNPNYFKNDGKFKRIEKECCYHCKAYTACTYMFYLGKNSDPGDSSGRFCCDLCADFNEDHCHKT